MAKKKTKKSIFWNLILDKGQKSLYYITVIRQKSLIGKETEIVNYFGIG